MRRLFSSGSARYPAYRRIRQLLYLLGIILLVFSVLAMGWTLRNSYTRMADDAQHDVATSATVSATQVARLMDRVANVSQRILRDRDFRRCLSRDRLACVEQHLARVLAGSPEVSSLVIVDADGYQLADSIPEVARQRRFRDHILLSKALASDNFLISTLHTDLATRGRVLPMLHGLTDEQGRKFVLIAAINLAVLDTALALDEREWQRTLILFRSDGAVLLSRPSWLRLESVIGTQFYSTAFQEQSSGQSEEVLQNGQPLLRGGWTSLNDWPLGVYVGVEAREIREEWLEAVLPVIAAALTAIVLGMGMLILLLHQLRRQEKNEQRIVELATRDPVTGLLNRHALLQALDQALAGASPKPHALLFLDLDRFKAINDSLGHAAGDAVLVQMAHRLQALVQEGETLGRLGGDEFVVLVPGSPEDEVALIRADQILKAFVTPFELESGLFTSSTSIGLSFFPDDAADPATLLRHADMAMYAAKAQGRNRYCVYESKLDTHSEEKLELERQLQQALQNDELYLLFQPQFSLGDKALVGAEALLRWRQSGSELDAEAFIALAEECRLIIPIGLWALRQACLAACDWPDSLTVTVNLSPLQLRQADLPQQVAAVLADTGLPAVRLELEVTESVVVHDISAVLHNLQGLEALGVRLSIDDFGVGYSQLSYLKRFDFDKIQIAQAFVQDIEGDANDAAIVRAIIQVGKSLDIEVGAKGVTSQAQIDFLRAAGADVVQGYFCAEPLSAQSLKEYFSLP